MTGHRANLTIRRTFLIAAFIVLVALAFIMWEEMLVFLGDVDVMTRALLKKMRTYPMIQLYTWPPR